jgi:molecular chaperone GrpE (heat shock protein)
LPGEGCDAAAGGDQGTPADDGDAGRADQTPAGNEAPDHVALGPQSPATEPPPTEPPADPAAQSAEVPVAESEVPPAEPPAAESPPPETQPAVDSPAAGPAQTGTEAAGLPAAELLDALTALTKLGTRVDDVADAVAELARLRSRDTDLIARLHDDVTKLRSGEIAVALNPVVTGMIKLHDQMVSLGALSDPASPVGMLHKQLLQIMELTCAVRPFTPPVGERFDASLHTGARRIPTTDASADGTIASTIRAGFVRADGSVVRVAEVEVHRLSG